MAAVANIFLVINVWTFFTEDPDTDAFLPVLLSLISCFTCCYFSVAGFVNKTKIIIGEESVKVKSYPLLFPGDRTFSNRNIVGYHTRNNLNPRRICQRVKFEIHALTGNGQQFKVLDGISSQQQAELIRSELAKYTPGTGKESAIGSVGFRKGLMV